MQTTSNHGFKKPEYSDTADIADLNFNFDKIDQMPVLYRQSTEPTNKIAGKTLWYDTSSLILKIWNGSSWDSVGGCDFMLSDTEIEINLTKAAWCQKLANSRFAVQGIFEGPYLDYWTEKILEQDGAKAAMIDSYLAMSYIAKLSDWMTELTSTYYWKNELACSAVAMQSIFKEIVGRTIMLYEDYIGVVWINENSAEVWKGGSPAVPHTYNDYVSSSIIDGYTSGGKGLRINKLASAPTGYYAWSADIDLTDVSSIEIYTQKAGYSSRNYLQIKIDGTSVYNSTSGHSWTKRTFDVSSLTGVKTIELALVATDNPTPAAWADFSDICLVKSA